MFFQTKILKNFKIFFYNRTIVLKQRFCEIGVGGDHIHTNACVCVSLLIIVQFNHPLVEYIMSTPSNFSERPVDLEYQEFCDQLKKLADDGIGGDELTVLVREVMEDRDERRVQGLLDQWGKDVAYNILQWGMFWQYPGVEIALPYFHTLTQKQQRKLAYEAVSEGYTEVLEQALPILTIDDQCIIIDQTFELFPKMAQMVYKSCDPPKVIEALKIKERHEAAQWLFDLHRPVHEKQILEEVTAGNGAQKARNKI